MSTALSIKAHVVGPIVRRVAHVSGGSVARAQRQRVGRILMFHGIGDPHYPVAAFRAQLRNLAKSFTIVPLGVLIEHLRDAGGAEALAGEVALTFDDGLRNHGTQAYPVLRELGVPATFFVCPELIERKRWIWTHDVAERLRTLDDASWRRIAADVDAPWVRVEALKDWMKTLSLPRRLAVEERIRAATPHFVPTAQQRERFDPMTWDELRRLDPDLITVGSHTLTHPILTTLGAAQAAVEIHESRRWLEAELGRAVELFCYPDGAHDDTIAALAHETYQAAVTASAGLVRAGLDRHRLPRIPADAQPWVTTWRLHRPTA